MKIIIAAATDLETKIAKEKILDHQLHEIIFCTTGIGLLSSAVSLMEIVFQQRPDLIIHAGIAGGFDKNMQLGNAFVIKEEILGDLGVEENDGWKDIFDLKLEGENHFPFENKKLINREIAKWNLLALPETTGLTVNEISTDKKRISQLKEKYDAALESMEGAALHYVCRKSNMPFIQLRTVSNYVGERDKTKWLIKKAIGNLNEILLKYIDELNKIP